MSTKCLYFGDEVQERGLLGASMLTAKTPREEVSSDGSCGGFKMWQLPHPALIFPLSLHLTRRWRTDGGFRELENIKRAQLW